MIRRKGCRNKFLTLWPCTCPCSSPWGRTSLTQPSSRRPDQGGEELLGPSRRVKCCNRYEASAQVAGLLYPAPFQQSLWHGCGKPLPPRNRVTGSLGMGDFYFHVITCLHGTMRIDWIILLIVCCLCGMGQKVQKKCGICFTAFE